MKKTVILIFGLLLMLHIKSQDKTDAMLFGDVKISGTEEHIPFATITVKGTTIGTMTDASGHYKLANIPIGKCIIIAKCVGYKAQQKEVDMKKGESTVLYFELEEDVMQVEQVVVTGTRTQHFIKDVPIRTEVITAKEIEQKNACSLYEALDGIQGVRVEQQCQFCNFSMVRMQGLGAEHTQVLINGQPIYSGLAGIYGLQQISTNDIDRIEVVKGAGSALYGCSAVAGAINIITKEPSLVPSAKVGVQFGSHNTNKYDISASLRNEKGNIGLSLYGQKLTGDAIDETADGTTSSEVENEDGISDRVASNLNNAGFGLYIDNLFSANEKLIIKGRYMYEKREGGTMDDDYYKNPLTDGTENITTDRYESELTYKKSFKNNSELNFSLAYTYHNRNATNDSYLGDYMATHEDNVPDLRNMRPYLANENSFTALLTYGLNLKNHYLLFGVQAFNTGLEESGMYVVVDEESDYYSESYRSTSNKSATEFGAFIQDEWTIGKALTIVPGVRFDSHHSEEEYEADRQVFASTNFPKTDFSETSFNPRLALKYEINKRFTVRASAGTGFRAPYGFSEDLHLCSGSPRVWKSSELNPETSVSYNLSADYYGAKTRVSANVFRTDLKDKIGFTDASETVASLGYDYQWENIDDAYVQGVELSIMANVVKNLNVGVDFAYNQGEYDNVRDDWAETEYEEDSKYISRFPATTANIDIDFTPKSWVFSITGNYQGKMYIDYFSEDENLSKIKETDPFMLFNAKVSKTWNIFTIYLGGNNLFNYVQPEKHTDDAAFMYAPVYGSIFYGGITINLKSL